MREYLLILDIYPYYGDFKSQVREGFVDFNFYELMKPYGLSFGINYKEYNLTNFETYTIDLLILGSNQTWPY